MKKTWIWIISAVALMVVGALIFSAVMLATDFKFSEKYEAHEEEVNGAVKSILIDTKEADINILPSEDGKCRVVCDDKEKTYHSVKISDGELSIKLEDNRKWYNYISFFNFKSPSVTVYLPTDCIAALKIDANTSDVDISKGFTFDSIDISVSTGDVSCQSSSKSVAKIHTSTGDISLVDMTAGSIDLRVSSGSIAFCEVDVSGDISLKSSTGRCRLSSVKCKNLTSVGGTGNLLVWQVIAENHMHIERTTGDVDFYNSDADSIKVKVSTGNVTGTLASDKIFNYSTGTGKVELPSSTSGGLCEITTSTGDIRIEISPASN